MPVRWERSTREVAFYVCQLCCERLEVDLDNSGHAFSWLLVAVNNHYRIHHIFDEPPAMRSVQLMVRTAEVDLDAPIELCDIVTMRSLKRRASTLAGCRNGPEFERALLRLQSRIRTLVARQGHYVCKLCGHRIIKQRAEKYGYGVSHKGVIHLEIQAQDAAQALSSSSSKESIPMRREVRTLSRTAYR